MTGLFADIKMWLGGLCPRIPAEESPGSRCNFRIPAEEPPGSRCSFRIPGKNPQDLGVISGFLQKNLLDPGVISGIFYQNEGLQDFDQNCHLLPLWLDTLEFGGRVKIKKISSAQTKNKQTKMNHAKLYSDLCQTENRGPLVALDSPQKRG